MRISLLLVFCLLGLGLTAQTTKADSANMASKTVDEQMPEYPGGLDGLNKFLIENIRYPDLAQTCGCSGTVYVQFIVNEEGTVTNVGVYRGVTGCGGTIYIDKNGKYRNKKFKGSYEINCKESADLLAEESIRVIKAMPKWTPGKKDGEPVKYQLLQPVKFTLR